MKHIKSQLLIVLMIFGLFFNFYFLNEIQKMKYEREELIEFTATTQITADFFRTNYELNMIMTGVCVPDAYCMNNQSKRELLSEMVKDKPLLIFRIDGFYCRSCYADILTELQTELSNIFHFDDVSVLCSQLSERDLSIIKRTYNLNFSAYIIPAKSFNWTVEERNVPYFFVLHPDMKISHIYIPEKKFPEHYKQYFKEVKKILDND